ncbi:helix-turn-helix transcriptional regulator [Amycolatopsis jejuensis]|uniref:helix-turn-helix transcriptional regulator n=1 Tax=Amycolatopsis jejuensis TaxID=330084 RepID=UPI00068BBD30|nr:PAS domain-containing protein [Amycolatopsis jejuensis]
MRAAANKRSKGSESVDFSLEEQAYAAKIVKMISPLVEPLAEVLQPRTEVVLHDFTKFPNTIVAIGGTNAGRGIGGPPTDLGIQTMMSGASDHLIRYRTEMPDGLVMRSSSLLLKAPDGRAVASLCINTDVRDVERTQQFLAAFASMNVPAEQEPAAPATGMAEKFPLSVEALAEGILHDAISSIGVPVELMKKAHKVAVVRELKERGFFTIREAAELAAEWLDSSRYTIYKYLNELDDER